MNVLGAFDGKSCGQVALERLKIIFGGKTNTYFSSEIDKYAISVAQYNYPNTIQLGCITKISGNKLPKIDLLIGGSPCQGFSLAGKQLNFKDPRSALFFEFVRLLKKTSPKHFMLENVRMKQEYQDIISDYLEVEPIEINSSLVSAQNRVRLYWVGKINDYGTYDTLQISQPHDKNIGWGSIREHDVSDNFYYSEKGLAWIERHSKRKNKKLRIWKDDEKCQMIEASHFKNYSAQRFFGIEDTKGLRYITPLECERAQTVPDNYTANPNISNTQRYKMLGNGWTIDVIAHIFKEMNFIDGGKN